jgi:hypothetical protein
VNLFAYTRPNAERGYTGYISVNREPDGTVRVAVRSHGDTSGAGQEITLSCEQVADLARALLDMGR